MNEIVAVPPKPYQLASWDKGMRLPRFVFDRYVGMEHDIVEFYQSLYFHKAWDGLEDTIISTKEAAHLNAKVYMDGLIQAGALHSAMETATVLQLHHAQKTQWYKYIGETGDISSVKELIELALAEQLEKDPTGGMRYEYQKLLSVMNTIEQMALQAATMNGEGSKAKAKITKAVLDMAANPKARSKMRESYQVVQAILDTDATEKEKLEMSAQVFKDVANSKVTFLQFRADNRARMGNLGKKTIELAPANIYLLSGKELVVIDSPNPSFTRSIESALRGLTDEFDIRDPVSLITKLNDILYTKGKYDHLALVNNLLEERSYGVRLPNQAQFSEIVIRELSASRIYIQKLVQYEDVSVPIYDIFRSYVPVDIRTKALELFGVRECEDEEIEEYLNKIAVATWQYYAIPDDAFSIIPKCNIAVQLTLTANSITIELGVTQNEGLPGGSTNQE